MVKMEDKIRELLEKEVKGWIEQEYRKRQELVKEEIEKQVNWARESGDDRAAEAVRAHHQRVMGYAMAELRNEVEFEADQWIIEEMGKRLKADAETQGHGDAEKKPKAKTGTKAKASTKTKSKTAAKKSTKTKS